MRRILASAAVRALGSLLLATLAVPSVHAKGLPDREGEREHGPVRLTQDELDARIVTGATLGKVGQRFGPAAGTLSGPPMPWTALGPKPLAGEYWSSDRPASGRANSVAIDPRNADRVYVATAQGGVWRSEDGGLTWTVLTDGLPTLASGDVALDPAKPDTVWYGTGEQNYSLDSYPGDGLYRSYDRGLTWTKVATRTVVGSYISRVVPAAGTASTIVVASNLGFVRSIDGGSTWAAYHPVSGYATDLVVDPTNRLHLVGAQAGSGVYTSDDGGATWTLRTSGLAIGTFARVNLGLSADGQRVYASFVNSSGGLAAMARSNDGGLTWALLAGVPNYLLTQGWYDNTVAVDPSNADVVVAGGVYPYSGSPTGGVIRSTNGGSTWTNVTVGLDGLGVHPDQHMLRYGPDGRLWLANDGGVFMSPDGGATWKACNDGLETLQFYTVGLHTTNPNLMSGGTQDNGTAYYTGVQEWPQLVAGDGGPTGFEWSSPSVLYSSYVRLNPLYKWNGLSYLGTVTGGWTGQTADWANGAFTIDPTQASTVLVGTNTIWRTKTSGASWTAISPNLSGTSALKSVTVPAGSAGIIWAGSAAGSVYLTINDGLSWSTANVGLPGSGAVNDIAVRPGSPYDAICGLDRSSGDRVMHYDAPNAKWTSLTYDLPGGLRVQSLAVDWRGPTPHVFVGTDHAVYAMIDTTWFLAGSGLPALAVYDLAVDTTNNYLVAATHGRGMWRTSLDRSGPAVAVTSPGAGSTDLGVGTTATIQWTAADPAGVTGVDVLLDDTQNAQTRTLATNVPSSGSFAWTVALPLSDDAHVRVVARDAWGNAAQASSGLVRITGQLAADGSLPDRPVVSLAGANPARGAVRVAWSLPAAAATELSVSDVQGRRVATLAHGTFAAGRYSSAWDPASSGGVAPGIYFVCLDSGGRHDVQRLVIAR